MTIPDENMLDRDGYRHSICQRLRSAQIVPFVKIRIGTWEPQVGHCHENVDQWVRSNPSHMPLRGWVTLVESDDAVQLTPHSVVRDQDGDTFDITPLENETIRPSMRFVPHIGDEAKFFSLMNSFQPFLACETEDEF